MRGWPYLRDKNTHPSNVRIIPQEHRRKAAVDLFRMGYDTADIAFFRDVPEAKIYSILNNQLSREFHARAAQDDNGNQFPEWNSGGKSTRG